MKPPTIADLEALPPDVEGEIIEGVFYTTPSQRWYTLHQFVRGEIAFHVGREADYCKLKWWIVLSTGLNLPYNTYWISSDILGWRRERMPLDLIEDEAVCIVPDWICEVLSPDTRNHDLHIKMPYYAKVGVPHAWIVNIDDADAPFMDTYQLVDGVWRHSGVYRKETEARIEPFADVALDVASWWVHKA